MSSNLLASHNALFAGRVNDYFHGGRATWKPNNPAIKKALETIMNADSTYLKKLERMQTTGMKDTLIAEIVKTYAPELARSANATGGKGKGAGKNNNDNNNNNNNNNKGKGKGKGKGTGKGTVIAFS